MRRVMLLGIVLVLGLGLVYLIFVRELPRTEEQAGSNAQQTVDLTGVTAKQIRGDVVEWVVVSEHARLNETLHQALLTPARFQVFQTGGDKPEPTDIQGSADSAFADQTKHTVILRGAGHIVKDGTLDLKGDVIEYNQATDVVKAKGHVVVTQDDDMMRADAAEYAVGPGMLKMQAPSFYQ